MRSQDLQLAQTLLGLNTEIQRLRRESFGSVEVDSDHHEGAVPRWKSAAYRSGFGRWTKREMLFMGARMEAGVANTSQWNLIEKAEKYSSKKKKRHEEKKKKI